MRIREVDAASVVLVGDVVAAVAGEIVAAVDELGEVVGEALVVGEDVEGVAIDELGEVVGEEVEEGEVVEAVEVVVGEEVEVVEVGEEVEVVEVVVVIVEGDEVVTDDGCDADKAAGGGEVVDGVGEAELTDDDGGGEVVDDGGEVVDDAGEVVDVVVASDDVCIDEVVAMGDALGPGAAPSSAAWAPRGGPARASASVSASVRLVVMTSGSWHRVRRRREGRMTARRHGLVTTQTTRAPPWKTAATSGEPAW